MGSYIFKQPHSDNSEHHLKIYDETISDIKATYSDYIKCIDDHSILHPYLCKKYKTLLQLHKFRYNHINTIVKLSVISNRKYVDFDDNTRV